MNAIPTRKRWGQHWLANEDLAAALVAQIKPQAGDRFLEIGPGPGELTRALLRSGARVTAVDIDRRCCDLLAKNSSAARLRIINADVLCLEPADLVKRDTELRLVGNLPYNICSALLRWSSTHVGWFRDAHLMLPAEVAERALSKPGGRTYGLLSVIVQSVFIGEIVRRLGPGAFRPPPTIESAFARLQRRARFAPTTRECLVSIAEIAFTHRRKRLVNSLSFGPWTRDEAAHACRQAGIDPLVRPESLELEAWARLAATLRRPRNQ